MMTDYTPFKKEMTYRMVKFYCLSRHGGETICEDCKGYLMRALDRLQNCGFKEKGYPCPNCPHCCNKGEDYDRMLEIVSFENLKPLRPDQASRIFSLRGIDDIDEAEREYDPRYNLKCDGMKKALLKVIQTKPYSKITVSDICTTAGISRSTFYSHYNAVIDLVDDCLFDLTLQVDYLPSQAGFEKWDLPPAGEPFCTFIRRNPGYRALVFDADLTDHAIDLICSCNGPRIAHTLMSKNIDVNQMMPVCRVAFAGCLYAIRENLDRSDEEWGAIKETMDCYHGGGLRQVSFR